MFGGPTDPAVSGGALPGRGAKEHAGQVHAGATTNQIAQVLPHRAPIAQVVMADQITLEELIVRLLGSQQKDLQGPEARQISQDSLGDQDVE